MDPKKISALDPKLRETYERVMGNSNPPVNQTPVAPSANQPQTTNIQTPSAPAQTNPQPQITITPNQPQIQPISGFMQTPPPQAGNLPQPQQPKEELPPLPPIMETQTVQNQPLMENLNMNSSSEDFTKSPFLPSTGAFVNPNPSAEEVTGVNQAANQPLNQKKKTKLLPIILIVGVAIFFVIYTIVWAKVFSLF